MKRRQAKHSGNDRGKSTGDGQRQPGDYFRKLAAERVRTDLERLTGKKHPSLTFTITKDFLEPRTDDAVMVSHTFATKKRGRPSADETNRIITAEAKRLQEGGLSQRKVAQQFFAGLSPDERYNRYRTRVKDNASKIQALLNKLNN